MKNQNYPAKKNYTSPRQQRIVTITSCIVALLCLWNCFVPASLCLPFHEANRKYLEDTSAQTLKSLGCVALIKGVADVIEGSSITASAVVVDGSLEIGDIAQPVLDVVTVIWNITLIVAAYLSALIIISALSLPVLKLLAIAYLLLFTISAGWYFLGCRLHKEKYHISMNKLMCLLCIIIVFIQFALPLTLRVSAFISQTTIAPIRTNYETKLTIMQNDFIHLGSQIRQSKEIILDASFRHECWLLFKKSTRELTEYACFSFAMWFIEGLLIPLCALLFNAWLVKQYVVPYLGLKKDYRGRP